MSKISLKLRRVFYRFRHGFFSIENVILLAAIVLCLFWTYKSIESMSRNWELAERLSTEQKSLELLKIEVETLELENTYYTSNEYQELAARRLLNKQQSGEHLVYLPENSDTAKNKHQKTTVEVAAPEYSNFEKWLMFIFPQNL